MEHRLPPIPGKIRPSAPLLSGRRKGFVYRSPGGFLRVHVSQSSQLGRKIRSDRERNGHGRYLMGYVHHALGLDDMRTEMQWLRPLHTADELVLFADVEWKGDLPDAHQALAKTAWTSGQIGKTRGRDSWMYAFCLRMARGTGGVLVIRKAVRLDDMQLKFVQSVCSLMSLCDHSAMLWEKSD